MKKDVKVIKEVKVVGKPLMLFNVGEGSAQLVKSSNFYNPFKIAKTGHEVKKFIFFNESGTVFEVNSGWFSKKQYTNNPYEDVSFAGELSRRNKVNYEATTPYYVSAGKDFHNTKMATVYIPVTYLESLGYTVEEETSKYDYRTVVTRTLVVGDNAFIIHLTSQTTHHFDFKKMDLVHEITMTTNEEELKKVLNKFGYYVR